MFVALIGFIIWRINQTPTPVTETPSKEVEANAVATPLTPKPGTYLIYQITTISDRGKPDWANDDVQETKLYRKNIADGSEQLISTSSLRSDQGSVVSQIYGKDILVRRFNGPDDAVIELDGTVTTKKSEWGTLRSRDGRFEVHYTSIYDDTKENTMDIRILNREDKTEKTLHFKKSDFVEKYSYEPVLVGLSSDGVNLFIRTAYTESDIPTSYYSSVNVNTGLITNISPSGIAVKKNETINTQLYPEQQMLLISVYGTKSCADCMGGDTATAPSKIYLYSIPQKTLTLVFEDKEFFISPVQLSEDARLLAYGINNENIWVTPFNIPRTNDQNITQGTLLDWMESGMVVERKGGDFVYIDSATKKITELGRTRGAYQDADFQRFEYIGSVTLR